MAKSVLITGASRGLGEGMARHFAERGYKLALTARSLDDLEDLRKEIEPQADQICIRELDVLALSASHRYCASARRNWDAWISW